MTFLIGFILGGLVAVVGMSVFIVGSDADDAEIAERVGALVLRLQEIAERVGALVLRLQEIAAERDALAEGMRLLESLTPGGSEFYNDPELCAIWVRQRLSSVTKQVLLRKSAEAERDALAERLQVLEAHNRQLARRLQDEEVGQ